MVKMWMEGGIKDGDSLYWTESCEDKRKLPRYCGFGS